MSEKIIRKLTEQAKNLEERIEARDGDLVWLETRREGTNDTNKYWWFHTAERDKYVGRLEGLREAIEIAKEEMEKT